MNILLIQDVQEARERQVFAIESKFGAKITTTPDLGGAIQILTVDKAKFDIMIVDYQAGTTADFTNFFSKIPRTPCIFCDLPPDLGRPPREWNVLTVTNRNPPIIGIIAALEKLISEEKLKKSDETLDYCKIRGNLLLSVCPLQGDIFIRLSKDHYVKLFLEGDQFETEDHEKYTLKKGVEYLYMKSQASTEFIQKYNDELEKILKRRRPVDFEELTQQGDAVLETIQDLGHTLGFREDVQNMVRTHIKVAVQCFQKAPSLAELFGKLESLKGKYIYTHSTLTGYLCCAIASKLDWGSDTTFQKLTIAAFLHDVGLENHALAKCSTLEEMNQGDFTPEEKEAFRNHTAKGAETVRGFQEIPPDVDIIVSQHHELPDGTGFPKGLNAKNLSPLTCVFLVAHDMAKEVLKNEAGFTPAGFLEKIQGKYTASQFKKILVAIKSL